MDGVHYTDILLMHIVRELLQHFLLIYRTVLLKMIIFF